MDAENKIKRKKKVNFKQRYLESRSKIQKNSLESHRTILNKSEFASF